MSNFSQFFPGAIPLGEVAYFPGAGATVVDGGATYLNSSVLAANDGSYARLLEYHPALGVTVAAGVTTGNASQHLQWVNSAAYFALTGNSAYKSATINGAYVSVSLATISSVYDSCMMGTTLLVAGDTGMNYCADAATFNYVNIGASGFAYTACAVNAAGTLAVMCKNAGGTLNNIGTSTNGTAWTGRTPTGGTAGGIAVAGWSPVASAFVYLTATPKIYTTTDGYALTERTLPAGITPQSTNGTGGRYIASTATSTIIACASNKLIRTADGTTWAAQDLGQYCSRSGNFSIVNISGTYYAYGQYGEVLRSTDDGVTWARFYTLYDSAHGLVSGEITSIQFLGTVNGAARMLMGNASAASYVSSPAVGTANYVGTPQNVIHDSTTGYASVPGYVRVK